MIYPLMTFPDATEMTFSKMMNDKNVSYFDVYFERWNNKRNDFDSLQVRLPKCDILKETGFTKNEVKYFVTGAKYLEKIMRYLMPQFEQGRIKINAPDR